MRQGKKSDTIARTGRLLLCDALKWECEVNAEEDPELQEFLDVMLPKKKAEKWRDPDPSLSVRAA